MKGTRRVVFKRSLTINFHPQGYNKYIGSDNLSPQYLKDSAFEQTLSRTLLFAQGTRTLNQQ